MRACINPEMRACVRDQNQINEFVILMEEKTEPSSECCISRVPRSIRRLDEEAYTPRLISIGPLHRGKEELADMETQKKIYINSFRKRTTIEKMEEILTFINNNKQRIHNFYAENYDLESNEFVLMILYDAIFIIELFLRNYCGDTGDFFLDTPAMKSDLSLDLRLLENQLPYFVLEELSKLAIACPTFMEITFSFFGDNCLFNRLPDEGVDLDQLRHFTDLSRSVLLKRYKGKPCDFTGPIRDLPSAVRLRKSGVKFRCIKRRCLLDIRFENRIFQWSKVDELQIPNLEIDDNTECLLRNMMAFEQCYSPWDTRVRSYVYLIHSLIDSEKDVDLLAEKGILTISVGNNASVAAMFNRLCLHIHVDKSIYHDTCEKLKKHYSSRWNHAKATLKRIVHDILTRTGAVGGFVLLVFTIIQVVCAIISVA